MTSYQVPVPDKDTMSDRSLAFTALMELDPAFPATPEPAASALVGRLASAITLRPATTARWDFAKSWVAAHTAAVCTS